MITWRTNFREARPDFPRLWSMRRNQDLDEDVCGSGRLVMCHERIRLWRHMPRTGVAKRVVRARRRDVGQQGVPDGLGILALRLLGILIDESSCESRVALAFGRQKVMTTRARKRTSLWFAGTLRPAISQRERIATGRPIVYTHTLSRHGGRDHWGALRGDARNAPLILRRHRRPGHGLLRPEGLRLSPAPAPRIAIVSADRSLL